MPTQRAGAPPRTAYTVREVAESLNVSVRHVRRLITRGDLEVQRFGGAVRIPAHVLHAISPPRPTS